MRFRDRRATEQGVTLIECILAVVIVGGALVVGLDLMGAHAASVRNQGETLWAELVLANELELVRTDPYDLLESRAFDVDSVNADYEVSRVVAAAGANCVSVQVIVRWVKDSGDVVSRELTTFRCKGGT